MSNRTKHKELATQLRLLLADTATAMGRMSDDLAVGDVGTDAVVQMLLMQEDALRQMRQRVTDAAPLYPC